MLETLVHLRLSCGRPWWLVLIPLIVPPLILISLRSLAGLGRFRKVVAILLRSVVVTALVLAVAELQVVRTNDKLTTLFLVDVSQSIPRDLQGPMREYVNETVRTHKRAGDLAGVIVFGKEPRVESPPTAFPNDLMGLESIVDPEYTDLASALKLALATFPEETARRIVVLSDGNENRGTALEQALAAKGLNVQIDVLPIDYRYDREVLVEKIALPPDVKKGETVNINVVVRASAPTKGTLQIYEKRDNYRSSAGGEQPVPVELKRGVNVFTLKQTIIQPDFYTFTAEFIPEAGSGDRRAINNIAEGFTQARGEARVLLIEGKRGEHNELVQALRDKGLEVTVLFAGEVQGAGVVGGDPLPSDLAQLQPFDTVILGNVPKDVFSEAQLQLLETNVHDMGAGLIMLGGEMSFGAGGWLNSPVERALPVDMQIRSMKVQVKSATVMIMHATEIPEGNYWMKVIAQEALKTLAPYDYAGMLHWNNQESWVFTVQPIGANRTGMLRAIDRMTPNDMPDFGAAVQKAMQGLLSAKDAGTRHIIIISDGDPAPPPAALINQLIQSKITVTTVLTAAHSNDLGSLNRMKAMAMQTKGRFYNVTNPKALPKIYQKEARLISRPLIFEGPPPAWLPIVDYPSEPITGLPAVLPPISGLVLTSRKENELVEVPLKSPLPLGQENPLLAHWTYGLGRSVAFTADAGRKWATQWPSWDSYEAFWSQVVRWSLRPVDRGNLTLALRREEGRIKVVVDALDKDDQFLNFLQIRGIVVKPDLGRESVELAQVAPGRYEGTIEGAEARGNYFVSLGYVGPEGTQGILQTGVSVPYSDEYRELQSDPETLATLAAVTDGEVLSWKTRRDGLPDVPRTAAATDVFRRDRFTVPPRSFQDLWPDLLWLAALLFLADVAVRRIAPDLERMRRALANQWQALRGREVAPPVEYMEKLKSRKAEVTEQIDRTRSATRFEPPPLPTPSGPLGEPLLEETAGAGAEPTRATRPHPEGPRLAPSGPAPAEPESYTNRLLRAKQKVWEERDKEKGKP
jgi:uncharacterized membrane protein